MTLAERAQQAIITAHIHATMAYMHEMLNYKLPTLALSAAHDAAAMVPFITEQGATEIAKTVEREYGDFYAKLYQ